MKVKELVFEAFYKLDGEYIPFPDNPLHGKRCINADVKFKKEKRVICGIEFPVDVIKIDGYVPIDCELLSHEVRPDGSMIIQLCQDWG